MVVGVDGREGGRDALSLAGRLALAAGGALVAVHMLPFDQDVASVAPSQHDSMAEDEGERMLAAELAAAGLEARTRIVADTTWPARALHRVAESMQADVIVVGSTRQGTIGRVFVSDDAAATLVGSPCAVAVAPRGLASADWRPIQRIGVGFDSGPEAKQALAAAVALAVDCGASLAVRSVVASPVAAADHTRYDKDWLDRSRLALQQLDDAIAALPVVAVGEVGVGEPVAQLVELSAAVDLLVVGSRGQGPIRRTLVGSTAAKLTRAAHAPLLVLPRSSTAGQPSDGDAATDTGIATTA